MTSTPLVVLRAPQIDELGLPEDGPLYERFDDGSRFVAVPTVGTNEVTINVGASNVVSGKDERGEFQSAYTALQAFAQKRGGLGGFAATAVENSFGANEAYDGVLVSQEAGRDKNLMVLRLARFGQTIVFVSTDTDLTHSPVTAGDKDDMALINTIIVKLVSDKAR